MIWLNWRQHRLQLATGAGGLLLVGLVLLLTERSMTSYVHSSGLGACLASHGACDELAQGFNEHFSRMLNTAGYLNFVPLGVGLFWGAPLVARELEAGTDLLAWTQSVSRARWLATKLVVFVVAALAAGVGFTALFSWWSHPFTRVGIGFARITPQVFDFVGIAPLGYMVFALALGVAAGVFIRRTVPAMVVTIAGFLVARFGLRDIRGSFLRPIRAVLPFQGPDPNAHANWIVHTYFIDGLGHRLGSVISLAGCANSSPAQCLARHGVHRVDIYQPASRFWALQGIEFAIFAGLALVLLGAASWWVIRRA